jgi:hypothetical protein
MSRWLPQAAKVFYQCSWRVPLPGGRLHTRSTNGRPPIRKGYPANIIIYNYTLILQGQQGAAARQCDLAMRGDRTQLFQNAEPAASLFRTGPEDVSSSHGPWANFSLR